jgi:hypothetical protein
MDSVPTQAEVEAKVEDYITLVSGLVVHAGSHDDLVGPL